LKTVTVWLHHTMAADYQTLLTLTTELYVSVSLTVCSYRVFVVIMLLLLITVPIGLSAGQVLVSLLLCSVLPSQISLMMGSEKSVAAKMVWPSSVKMPNLLGIGCQWEPKKFFCL